MIKYYVSLLLALVLLISGVAVYASSDIGGAKFYGIISTSNNSTSPAYAVSSNITGLNSAYLISAGFLNSSANNCAIYYSGGDIPFMPGYDTNPWIMWNGDLTANAITNYTLYMKNVTGGEIRYFPGEGGMIVPDTITELAANNWTITLTDAWINTDAGEGKYLVDHYDTTNGGLRVYVSPTVPGTVTADIITVTTNTTSSAFRPDADGSLIELTPSEGDNYECSGDNDDGTNVSMTDTTYKHDLYQITNHTTEAGTINSVTVYFRVKVINVAYTLYAKPEWKIGEVSYNGTEKTSNSTTYVNLNETFDTSPATGVAWTWSELDDAEFGIWLHHNTSGIVYCADVWYTVNYDKVETTSVSVTNVPSGKYDIEISVKDDVFKLDIRGAS